MNIDIVSYYRDRANEYEKVYSKPERQEDLQQATRILQKIFRNKEVFEIACGTGYWTEKIAKSAKTILATDINESVIEIAKNKKYYPAKVDFQIGDIFNIDTKIKHESLFGGFIWSHIKIEDLNNFVKSVADLVIPGGTIAFIDNNYVEGSSLPIAEIDEQGNSYQVRQLENNSTYKVLKNFPEEKFLKQLLNDKASKIDFINLKYYWILTYENTMLKGDNRPYS